MKEQPEKGISHWLFPKRDRPLCTFEGTFDGTVKSDAQMWSRTRAGTVDRKVAARTSLAETDMQARAQVVVQRCTPGRQYLYHEQHCTKPYCEVYPV